MAADFVIAAVVFTVVGLMSLIVGTVMTWRAYRAATRLATALSAYTFEETSAIAEISARLNAHGFDLQHTIDELSPKIERVTNFLPEPLVFAAIRWVLRRAFGRPYRRL